MLGWSLPNDCAIVIEMSRKAGSHPGTLVPFVGTLVCGAGIQWFPGSEYSVEKQLFFGRSTVYMFKRLQPSCLQLLLGSVARMFTGAHVFSGEDLQHVTGCQAIRLASAIVGPERTTDLIPWLGA